LEYIVLYLLILIIPTIASIGIQTTYSKYKQVNNKKGKSGFEVARDILDSEGLNNMYIVEVKGNLTDHYDPTKKVIRLSSDIFYGETVAAAAVAAHECGHAIQDKENYGWMRIRSALVPFVNFVTYGAYILFFISIFLQMVDMLYISIIAVLFGLLFEIVTLPVEFDASKRAMQKLQKLSLVNKDEYEGAGKVLRAAAFTYVASVLSSILNLIRLLMLVDDRRGRR